jgi:pimeloyl-ACP methyl ester carboxylesterase
MTSDGVSIEDVYTRDVVDEIAIPGLGENIYKGFLGFLADLQDEEVIADYQPFAYDWRNSVFAVATQPVKYPDGETKRLLDEVLRLAEDSYTDKVTIVAHSNGGLVAKALLHEYGETALAGKVDKLVMIGTPQLGTPKGIGAMLHGTNQQALGGLVISDAVARDVIQNMPGAYTLLPSAAYFTAISSDAVVLADNSSETASVRGYGSVSSRLALENFMLDVQDTLPDNPTINQPLTLNAQLQQAARAEQDLLDAWQAPEGVEVYEVVGTGLATIRGFEYRSFSCSANPACILGAFMKPYPLFSNNGDETVIAGSAQGYGGDKMTAVINLELANAGVTNINREHADLTESPAVQTFVESVIKYPYLTAGVQVPDFADVSVKYTLIGVHSPVTPRIVTGDGRVIGRVGAGVRKEVPGSQYLELGGSTYLIIPTEVGDYTIELAGTGAGLFTLTIEQLGADNGRTDLALIVASSTPVLQGNLTVRDGAFSTLTIDMDGDGRVDEERTLTGELVLNNEVIVEPISSQSSSATRVRDRSPAAQVLGVATSQGPLIQSDSSTIIAGTLQQLTQVLQQRSYLTEVEVQTLTQLLQAISQFLAEQASAETNQ